MQFALSASRSLDPSETVGRPRLQVAVFMRRERERGPGAEGADVVPHEAAFGQVPRCLLQTPDEERWLHPGFTVKLFRDDAEGYMLNVSTPAPCWFMRWRMEEKARSP